MGKVGEESHARHGAFVIMKMCIRDRPKVLPVRVNGKMTRMKTLPLKSGTESSPSAAR